MYLGTHMKFNVKKFRLMGAFIGLSHSSATHDPPAARLYDTINGQGTFLTPSLI